MLQCMTFPLPCCNATLHLRATDMHPRSPEDERIGGLYQDERSGLGKGTCRTEHPDCCAPYQISTENNQGVATAHRSQVQPGHGLHTRLDECGGCARSARSVPVHCVVAGDHHAPSAAFRIYWPRSHYFEGLQRYNTVSVGDQALVLTPERRFSPSEVNGWGKPQCVSRKPRQCCFVVEARRIASSHAQVAG